MESSDGPECFQVTSLSKSFKEWSIKTGLFPFLVHAMVTKKLVFSTAYFLSCSTSKVNNMVNGYLGPDDYRNILNKSVYIGFSFDPNEF